MSGLHDFLAEFALDGSVVLRELRFLSLSCDENPSQAAGHTSLKAIARQLNAWRVATANGGQSWSGDP
jgi:hypothetical protein